MMISVCIAAWNGERYLREQLCSILNQLGDKDEVVVVDDASTDGTRECIRSLIDSRIRLIEHRENRGVQQTFEDAIRAASGEILFLSDQDDLWVPDKVAKVVQAFQLRPDVDVVVSDAALTDERGVLIANSYYAVSGGFRSGLLANVLHCRYLGCTMAFRRRVRERVLPFPQGRTVFHDLWIGTANSISGGRTIYLAQPLVYYRRHATNLTGNSRLPFSRQMRIRWDLLISLFLLWLRVKRGNVGPQ
jgi:glycosyltransferase involved in cell wall biosynthesis